MLLLARAGGTGIGPDFSYGVVRNTNQ